MRKTFGPALTIEDMDAPVVVVRIVGVSKPAEFEAYLAEMVAMMRRRRDRLAIVIDARQAGFAPSTQRVAQAEWLKKHAGEIRERSVGMAFVFSSALVRGTLTAVLWLSPLPTPHFIAATEGEARTWCEAQLEKARRQSVLPPQHPMS